MAAKKKTAKKKAAKKKAAVKKSAKKKAARKRASAPKKKAVTKKKAATKKKSSPDRKTSKKKAPVKKTTRKPSVPKESRPRTKAPKGGDTIIIITEEVREIRPRVTRDIPIAVEVVGATVDVRFELGMGRVTVLLFRNGEQIGEQELDQSGVIDFPDVRARDVISLNGVCSGTARIFTNRTTLPVSDEAHPRRFIEQNILDTLLVR